MSNINITVYTSKSVQEAAERAEMAAGKASNIQLFAIKNELPAPTGTVLPTTRPDGSPVQAGDVIEVLKGTYTQSGGANVVVAKDKGRLYFKSATKWGLSIEWDLPKGLDGANGANGKTTELFNPAKTGGYAVGDSIYYPLTGKKKTYLVISAAAMGEHPDTHPDKFEEIGLNSNLVEKSHLGYTLIAKGTNFIQELVNSSIDDTELWGIGGINITNGTINPGTSGSPSVYRHSINYYRLINGVDLEILLQVYSPAAFGIAFYDKNKVFLRGVTSYQSEVVSNSEDALFFRISHHKDIDTEYIYVKNKADIWDESTSNLLHKGEVPTNEEFSLLERASIKKADLGYVLVPIDTEYIPNEIKSSVIDDAELWHQNKVYKDTDGSLVNGSGFIASVNKYAINPNYNYKVFLQLFSGNTGLCLYRSDNTFVKCIKSYQDWVTFNSEDATYFTITHRNTLSPSFISLINTEEVYSIENPTFIPSSKEGDFVKKGELPETLIFNRFLDVEKNNSFPKFCQVGKFNLIRNTDIKTGEVLKDYDIQHQNYPIINKIRIINTIEIPNAVYDVAPNGDMYSVNGKNILISTDMGVTWSVHTTISDANSLYWVFYLENGELLVFDRTIRGVDPSLDSIGGIFTSSSGHTVWTKTMTYRNRYIQLEPAWCFEQNGQELYLSEYGNSATTVTVGDPDWNLGTKADANQIWKSDNYGITWYKYVKLSELEHLFPQTGGLVGYLHIHAIHFDRYWNRLWVTTGDGSNSAKSNKKLAWTDDGVNWFGIELSGYYAQNPNWSGNTAYENLQGLSMISTNEVLLIGADCWNNAIFRVNKRKRNEIFLEDAYYASPDITNDITYFTGRMVRYERSPIFITFGQGDAQTTLGQNSRWPKVVATWDGVHFVEVWKDEDTPQGIAQDWFYVWKIKEKYYLHVFYESINKKYLIEFEF